MTPNQLFRVAHAKSGSDKIRQVSSVVKPKIITGKAEKVADPEFRRK